MKDYITYTFGMNLQERMKAFKDEPIDNSNLENLKEWKERKGLLKEKHFQLLQDYYHLKDRDFDRGLLPFTEELAEKLVQPLDDSEWFQFHQSLFQSQVPIQSYSLKTGLRFHVAYYQSFIEKLIEKYSSLDIKFEATIIETLSKSFESELFSIAQRTIVWDVHHMIEEHQITGETPEDELLIYLKEFVGDSERTFLFFGEYPTLARVLAQRLMFACDNIEAFFIALKDSKNDLYKRFDLALPLYLTSITPGQGDSHEQGKTVIKFSVNNKNLIFKFKDLLIGERFNQFLSYVESLHEEAVFYKVQRLVTSEYTIEEEVTYESCSTQDEINQYYQNFGFLLAIVYWLGTTDLHMENLIAHGRFPVLIDVETLIRPDIFPENIAVSRQNRIEDRSIIASGILPQGPRWKRQLEFDALSGKRQKLPFKVRKLKNEQSSAAIYELDEAYLPDSQNIPMLKNEKIDFEDYTNIIENSFLALNGIFLQHKEELIQKVKKLFSGVTIRLLYRDTQDYGNFLSFANHPSCATNYLEREKVIENLWGSLFVPKELIPFEIEAMLENDIPTFYANTSSTSVISAKGTVKNILPKSPIVETIQHIQSIDSKRVQLSYLLLKESLGNLKLSLKKILVPENNLQIASPYLQKAADIGDLIVDNLIYDTKYQKVDWLMINPVNDQVYQIDYPTSNLYNGTSGIYLFLYLLNHHVPKQSYQKIIDCLEKEVFHQESVEDSYESAFFGSGAKLSTAFILWRGTDEDKFLHDLHDALIELEKLNIPSENKMDEWLYGKASLISLLASVYKLTLNSEARHLLNRFTREIALIEMDDASFSHGYGGVLYALIRANKILKSTEIGEKIGWYKENFLIQMEEKKLKNESWCRGKLGIKMVYDALDMKFPIDVSLTEKISSSCICHGFFSEMKQIDTLLSEPIMLHGTKYYFPVDLFCGLSGIGYQLISKELVEKNIVTDLLSLK